MLYLIGLGLNEKGISQEGLEAVKKCSEVYLENYTVEFPYSKEDLEKVLKKEIEEADRDKVEGLSLVEEAKSKDIVLLVYGAPLTATTHISLIQEAEKKNINYEVIYSGSIFDAIAETGLQFYKFGKIASMPNFEADSFIKIIKENQKINAHSLILIDIGLEFKDALKRLERLMKKERINAKKIVACEMLGTNKSKIHYGDIRDLKNKKIKAPFCFIIPHKMHFIEKEMLDNL